MRHFWLIGRPQGLGNEFPRRRHVRFASGLVAVMLLAGATPARADAIATPFGAAAAAAVSTNFGSEGNPTNLAVDPSSLSGFFSSTSAAHILPSSLDNGQTGAAASTDGTGLVDGGSGTANASADLASGTLRVFAETTGAVFVPAVNQAVPLLNASAQAGFEDTLTALADGTMHFNISIDGSVPLLVSCANATGACIGGLETPGGFSAVINLFINGAPAVDTTSGRTLAVSGEGAGIGCYTPGPCDVDFAVDVPVLLGDTLDFDLTLQVEAAADTADFSHTLTLDASGVPFTSASGAFLTAPVTAVPEPSTITMVGFGALVLGLMRHRRRRGPVRVRAGT